jgi:hypothetical protein
MKHEEKASAALNNFYTAGYEILQENRAIQGLFVSDCAILFVNSNEPLGIRLTMMLKVVNEMNRRMLQYDMMLTTSIAFGPFSYHQRLEFQGIEKNPVIGNAYLAAYLDNANGTPKIQPGQCRILRNNIDEQLLLQNPLLQTEGKYTCYYWMVDSADGIPHFRNNYADAYQLKYRGMLEAIKGHRGRV